MMSTCQVAIVGAGPHGLAAASHLRAANIDVRVFGKAMSFWDSQMPKGMMLRSPWDASHIADPRGDFKLDRYQQAQGASISRPIPLSDFVRYGQWFARQVVPDLDQRRVTRIEPVAGRFRLLLEDGDTLHAQRVIVATGVSSFVYRPAQFDGLPSHLASHAYDHRDLSQFRGQSVLVVGAGQSPLESAALLHEAGADVEVVIRTPRVIFPRRRLHKVLLLRRLAYAPSEVGPPGLSWLVHFPDLFTRLSEDRQRLWAAEALRPVGAIWLKPRLRDVPITTTRSIVSATPASERLCVKLDDGSERVVDHALLGTGYRVDVDRYDFIAPQLLEAIDRANGHPKLNRGFESSVPGLHFVGAPAAMSFGPLMRFVAGTPYMARLIARAIAKEAPSKADAVPEFKSA